MAQALAERHGVEVVGFDQPELDEAAVRQFAAAVDRVLTDYPSITLDIVAVADLGGCAPVVRWDGGSTDAMRSMTLDQRAACVPGHAAAVTVSAVGPDAAKPADLPIYAATVGEFGVALDAAGGGVVGRSVQHILIAEYMRLVAGRYTTLGEVVRGYRSWRAGLTGIGGGARGFDPVRALCAGFADVVLHGDQACVPAKTLHAALVDAASARG